MNKIDVFRTHIEIHDYYPGQVRQLEKKFSVYNMAYHRYEPKGRYYDEETQTLYIPRGVSIGYLENLFHVDAYIHTTYDPVASIGDIKVRYKPRNDIQQEALQFMLSLGKYESNKKHAMLSLNLATGKGKTYCSITAMSYLQKRGIIITNSNDWLAQWKAFFLEYTDIKSNEIYYISGTPTLMKLFNRDISKYKVVLCTHATLKSYATRNGWNAIGDFFKYMQFGIKVYDEAHLNFDNMFMIDCFTNTWLTYYVTATPYKSNDEENVIYKECFKGTPSISLFNPDLDPHTQYIGIRYNSCPNPIQISECKNSYGMDRNRYVSYLVGQENFFRMLRILIDKAIKKPGKHLYYIGTNEAILIVRDWIYKNYPELIGEVGIFTTLTSKEDKRSQLDKTIILSTTKSAGAAIDISGLVETVVLAEPFKSRVLAEQTFGRTRADNTTYKEIVDNGFFFTKRFYEQKKPIYMKIATECKEVSIRTPELISRSDSIQIKHNSLKQPMGFTEEYKELVDPIEFVNP